MRFLGIGDSCDLASLYLRLAEEGHEVKVAIAHPLCQGTLAGMIDHVQDWKAELAWIKAAEEDGCILFENVSGKSGETQDQLRLHGFNVIGSSAYGARLENDRSYAQQLLGQLGLHNPFFREFTDAAEACKFIDDFPRSYAIKYNGAGGATHIGSHPTGGDIKAILAARTEVSDPFILTEVVHGVEMGVGAYFNGEDFLEPACLDWEHKRFFPGNLGELTGEMGTVVTYSRSNRFFNLTLRRVRNHLRQNGYCGYINLNTIVNESGIWPLEFTCRFGYPGFAILQVLQRSSWGEIFSAMITRGTLSFPTLPGFAVGLVLTTPPFPYSRENVPDPIGIPISLSQMSSAERQHLHLAEVGLREQQLVTSGISGWTMVATGTGQTIADALEAANALARKVNVMNLRYRWDIGSKLINGDLEYVERLGLLDTSPT